MQMKNRSPHRKQLRIIVNRAILQTTFAPTEDTISQGVLIAQNTLKLVNQYFVNSVS